MKGRICIITRSNSGIGKETAIGLAKMGATIVMVVIESARVGAFAHDGWIKRDFQTFANHVKSSAQGDTGSKKIMNLVDRNQPIFTGSPSSIFLSGTM